jgi:YesN/AraC family two-component response regulator
MAPALYFKTMLMIAPALCSLVCMQLVMLLAVDYRNAMKQKSRVALAVLYLTITVLWLAALTIDDPTAVTKIILTAAAFTVPPTQVLLTHRIIRRGGLKNHTANQTPRPLKIHKNTRTTEIFAQNPKKKLTVNRLEDYFQVHRPYLDPEFRLVDLAEAMDVNRSDMSAFINKNYGIGFKRYINRWRLVEYERLMALPSGGMKNPYRIVKMAGFTDPRHFHRVVEVEREEKNDGR